MKINVQLYGYTRLDFDRRPVRRALLKEAREIRKEARRNYSRRVVSAMGEFPGLDTGDTRRSISIFPQRSGFGVVIAPRRTERMRQRNFFPTILVYGDESIQPRADAIEAAFNSRRAAAVHAIGEALRASLRVK